MPNTEVKVVIPENGISVQTRHLGDHPVQVNVHPSLVEPLFRLGLQAKVTDAAASKTTDPDRKKAQEAMVEAIEEGSASFGARRSDPATTALTQVLNELFSRNGSKDAEGKALRATNSTAHGYLEQLKKDKPAIAKAVEAAVEERLNSVANIKLDGVNLGSVDTGEAQSVGGDEADGDDEDEGEGEDENSDEV